MKRGAALLLILLFAAPTRADDMASIGDAYRAVRDSSQLVLAFSRNESVNAATVKVARDSYAGILKTAEKTKDLSADDMWAVGECHAALGDNVKAAAAYRRSLEKKDSADARLGLARLLLATDVKEADQHFEKAAALDPEHRELGPYHLLASQALESRRDWTAAATRMERYLAYLKKLSERYPKDCTLLTQSDYSGLQLDRLRRYAAMMAKMAPDLKPRTAIQGDAVEPATLKGKVVLLDFCAIWSPPSRRRMELLQGLSAKYADKGLEIVGCTQIARQAYSADDDKTHYDADLTPEKERAGIAAFTAKHGIKYRLTTIGPAALAEYGVLSLPHTVLLDREGKVRLIFLGTEAAREKELEAAVEELLKAR
jgi:thiol-disulfide isomerase/thioredoxin